MNLGTQCIIHSITVETLKMKKVYKSTMDNVQRQQVLPSDQARESSDFSHHRDIRYQLYNDGVNIYTQEKVVEHQNMA